jgi:hypothetical protein
MVRQLHFAALDSAGGYVFRIPPFGLQALGPVIVERIRLLDVVVARRQKRLV